MLPSTNFYPMFAHEGHHIEEYLKAVDHVFRQIAAIDWKEIGETDLLKGKPAASGFVRLN